MNKYEPNEKATSAKREGAISKSSMAPQQLTNHGVVPIVDDRFPSGTPYRGAMEDLSKSAFRAVVAAAGYHCVDGAPNAPFTDLRVHNDSDWISYRGLPTLKVQVKCTHQSSAFRQRWISYSDDASYISRLRQVTIERRRFVIMPLFEHPKWIDSSESGFHIPGCLYWVDPAKATVTEKGGTIRVPRSNVLTPEVLHRLMTTKGAWK